MVTETTNGVKVSVEPQYRPNYSNPEVAKFMFSYDVIIENISSSTIQLIARRWTIFDSIGQKREVTGAGVIGKQPTLQPLEKHEYSSWCPLVSEIGFMEGVYIMQDTSSNSYFEVNIPRFSLVAPQKLN